MSGKHLARTERHNKRHSNVPVRCPGCGGKYVFLMENGECKNCNEVAEIEARLLKARER